MTEDFCLLKYQLRLMLHNPELTDPVIDVNPCIPHGEDRHKPLVVVTAVGLVNDTHMIRLNHAEIFIGAAAGYHMGLVYIGVSVRGQMYVEEYHFEGERSEVRESTVQAALALLKKGLEETDGNDEDH